jgi:hypothetical protein
MSNEVISFPASYTYDLVVETEVHAHPLKKGFPSKITPYMMVRAKGGVSQALYHVGDTIDIYPDAFSSICKTMNHKTYQKLQAYIQERNKTFGFPTKDVPYRFYILEKCCDFKNPFVTFPNPRSYIYYDIREIP